jgi:hypothetical protein
LNRVLYDKEINKKDVKYDDLKLHMTSVKSVSDHYKWPLSEDELSFLFGSSANYNGKTTTLTLKTLRNGIVHACNITNMKIIIENLKVTIKRFSSNLYTIRINQKGGFFKKICLPFLIAPLCGTLNSV